MVKTRLTLCNDTAIDWLLWNSSLLNPLMTRAAQAEAGFFVKRGHRMTGPHRDDEPTNPEPGTPVVPGTNDPADPETGQPTDPDSGPETDPADEDGEDE
jgi:hypothetical protein